jgi:DNA helicase-4
MAVITSIIAGIIALVLTARFLSDVLAMRRYREALREWRTVLSGEISRAGWISKGSMDEVVAELPPPASPTGVHLTPRGLPASVEEDVEAEFIRHNEEFRRLQRERLARFFETVERNPLTEEQVQACICMDDNVQIVAAAGSGKTSTMVAKAGYAILEDLAEPSGILLLAFNRDAAQELGTRIRDRLSDMPGVEQVTAKTFNAFGLSVIGEASSLKPSLPKWVTDSGEDIRMISRIIDDLSADLPEFALKWALYRTVYARDIGAAGDPETPDAYEKGEFGYRAASGDLVKSLEELVIANWLFFNQIEFTYEAPYEHDTSDAKHRQYHPDFHYPQIGLYHEHFALDRQGRAPAHFKDYVEGVEWKRQLHRERGTALIETQSWQVRSGEALKHLESELRSRGLEPVPDPQREPRTPPFIDNAGMAKLLRIFQQHVKSNGIDRQTLRENARLHAMSGYGPRIEIFMDIYEAVSDEWDRRLRLEGGVDYEDMLVMASELIEQGRYKSPYTLVLADEFQDSSRSRVRLLKALAGCRDGVRLCVVGDDWQGINRFAGADISVMTEFENEFPNATRLALATTFRCPQELCDASGEFVQANPAQIRKTVRTTNKRVGDTMVAFGFNDPEKILKHLEQRLMKLHAQAQADDGGRTTVLILGRYRKDRPEALASWQNRFGGRLDIEFRTVHRSKGLEADYVVVLGLIEKQKGLSFPATMEDDPLLQIPMPDPDPFPLAEERRLFYVALTRARRQVWLYTELGRQSRFLQELVRNGRVKVTAVDGNAPVQCPKCRRGSVITRTGQTGQFHACNRFPQCDYTAPIRQASSSR